MEIKENGLKKLIAKRKLLGLPESDTYIEGYVYSLSLSENDPLNFKVYGARKLMPTPVAIFVQNQKLVIREIRNGKILKKEIDYMVKYKPNLKVFLSKHDCLEEFQKDMAEAYMKLEKLTSKVNKLKNEIAKGLEI